jgi:hypothetical protein
MINTLRLRYKIRSVSGLYTNNHPLCSENRMKEHRVGRMQGSFVLRWVVESSWNVMAHGDAREGKWRGNWRMEWVASTLPTTSEHGVSSITTADAHTSASSSRLNWRSRRFKWTRPFRRKTKSGFCACAITFQTQSTYYYPLTLNQGCTDFPKVWEPF